MLQSGCEAAKHRANVSGLEMARNSAAWLQAQHAADLEMVALYESEINARIMARIEADKAFDFKVEAMETAYFAEMDRIAEVEAYEMAMIADWEAQNMNEEGDGSQYWED